MEKGARTGKGPAREGGAAWEGGAHGQGLARTRGAHVGRARARGARGRAGPRGGARTASWRVRVRPSMGRAWLQEGRIYVLPFLIGICQAFSSWLLA
jgi:hypothetical protein